MEDLPEKLKIKIQISSDGCWLWLAALDRGGYGVFRWDEKTQRAHRVVRALIKGPVTEELDHLCRVRNCVNPDHLDPVTHKVNVERGETGKFGSEYWKKKFEDNPVCTHGHDLSGDNLYIHFSERLNRTNRQCKVCRIENKRRLRKAGARY